MLKFIASLVAFVLSMPVAAVDRDVLEPCGEEVVAGYESRVDALIDAAIGAKGRLSFTTIPSFMPESGIRIFERDGKFYVAHAVLRESVWHSSWQPPRPDGRVDFKLTEASIPATVHKAELGEILVMRVVSLVDSEIGKARPMELLGLDGETYYFRTSRSGCAKTWSPPSGSRAAKLVALLRGVGSIAHVKSASSRKRTEDAIESLLAQLSRE